LAAGGEGEADDPVKIIDARNSKGVLEFDEESAVVDVGDIVERPEFLSADDDDDTRTDDLYIDGRKWNYFIPSAFSLCKLWIVDGSSTVIFVIMPSEIEGSLLLPPNRSGIT